MHATATTCQKASDIHTIANMALADEASLTMALEVLSMVNDVPHTQQHWQAGADAPLHVHG